MAAVHRQLSLEQRRKKFPLEYGLKDEYAVYLGLPPDEPVVRRPSERRMYETLKKLATAVIVHKYGASPRINYETLSHEIAASLFVTIVMRRKEVFSWTNLMKKVARDAVSNFLRKEYYDTVRCVSDPADPSEDGGGPLDHYEGAASPRPEDMVYLGQLVEACCRSLEDDYRSLYHLRHHLIFRLALYEVVHRTRHAFAGMLGQSSATRYNYYVYKLQTDLAPVLSAQFLGHALAPA